VLLGLANMRVMDQVMPTPQIMPSHLPNYWTMYFHVLPKQTRIASAFTKLLEMLLEDQVDFFQ
jgi:hypothetical protein